MRKERGFYMDIEKSCLSRECEYLLYDGVLWFCNKFNHEMRNGYALVYHGNFCPLHETLKFMAQKTTKNQYKVDELWV